MLEKRNTEVNVLGYRIEHVQTLDDRGQLATRRYDVLGPESNVLIGSFAQRAEAEHEIVMRELNVWRRSASA
ncbi:MAG: hypothetical protein ABI082_11190 [Dokdonella sp.]